MAKQDWAHAPAHRLSEGGVYMVTAATVGKVAYFQGKERLTQLCRGLLRYAARHEWRLEAWAVFANHYHFVGHSPKAEDNATSLRTYLSEFHRRSARWINKLDQAPGRQVWHNYWDTRLSYERSYLARLHYVHENPVKHGVVADAKDYPWCSAAEFRSRARPARVKTVYSFPIDRLRIEDDY